MLFSFTYCLIKNIPVKGFRCQPSSVTEEPYGPVHFSYQPNSNRFTPRKTRIGNKIKTYYFGIDFKTAFFEGFKAFRLIDLQSNYQYIPIAYSELNKIEIIEFEPQKIDHPLLNLLSLLEGDSILRHQYPGDMCTSTDISISRDFATELINTVGVDGIIYRSRFGGEQSVVVFEYAQKKLESLEVVSRKTLLQLVLEDQGFAEYLKGLNVYLLDDITED